ncbi:hypothetical protein [Leptolyngbya sp. AN10]|uniref:hypothetical protein n=1 Tax=Leptolyngbya sp. AN10 TaxID=3423365 RepID=UPI003D31577E
MSRLFLFITLITGTVYGCQSVPTVQQNYSAEQKRNSILITTPDGSKQIGYERTDKGFAFALEDPSSGKQIGPRQALDCDPTSLETDALLINIKKTLCPVFSLHLPKEFEGRNPLNTKNPYQLSIARKGNRGTLKILPLKGNQWIAYDAFWGVTGQAGTIDCKNRVSFPFHEDVPSPISADSTEEQIARAICKPANVVLLQKAAQCQTNGPLSATFISKTATLPSDLKARLAQKKLQIRSCKLYQLTESGLIQPGDYKWTVTGFKTSYEANQFLLSLPSQSEESL